MASDRGDAGVLSGALRGRSTRGKVVGFATVWGALCLGALAWDERQTPSS